MLYIVTPTYNRAKELCILYKTLKSQTCLDFKWLVVDDGSTDETPLLIAKFQEDSCVAIDYLKKIMGVNIPLIIWHWIICLKLIVI